jgi:hypothetical protein
MQQDSKSARVLTDDDLDAIALRIIAFSGLTNEEHKKQHEAFALYIERQIERAEFWKKIKVHVGGWIIVAALAWIGSSVWHYTTSIIGRG